jgi:hypothetical protein
MGRWTLHLREVQINEKKKVLVTKLHSHEEWSLKNLPTPSLGRIKAKFDMKTRIVRKAGLKYLQRPFKLTSICILYSLIHVSWSDINALEFFETEDLLYCATLKYNPLHI